MQYLHRCSHVLVVDGGRVAQCNDISHGENHPKQNAADKSPMMEVSDSAGEEIAFGRNSYLSSQPVQVRATASSPCLPQLRRERGQDAESLS